MGRRIFLLIAVNLLVITTITIVMAILGVGNYMTPYGLDYESLFVFCAVFGFGGAFISLALSRIMAKFMMRVQVIDPQNPKSSLERDLLQTVYRLAKAAHLPKMPEVGIYASPEVNAFATGPTKSRALVAVSEGLLQRMDGAAVEGVLGHEIAHIANGDMVTMTLIQGVVNTFVMFLARIAAWAVSQAISRDREPNPWINFAFVMLFQIILSVFGSMVVAYVSRQREFRADKGGAQVAGRGKMVHALESLQRSVNMVDESHQSMATLKISGSPSKLMALLSTHPPLEDRIKALQGSM